MSAEREYKDSRGEPREWSEEELEEKIEEVVDDRMAKGHAEVAKRLGEVERKVGRAEKGAPGDRGRHD